MKNAKGRGKDKTSELIKKRFLDELRRSRDKALAAKVAGVDLVKVRSWRQTDVHFNKTYKDLVIGDDDARRKENKKELVIKYLKMGCSQRMACDQAYVSTLSFRTWKKVDEEFKNKVNEIRRSFGAMKRGGFDPNKKDENL